MVALFNYLALIGAFLSLSLVLPAFVGFGTDDAETGFALLTYAALGGFFSLGVLMATRGRKITMNRVTAIYLAAISWLFFPLVLAIPISDVFGIGYGHAIFEAVSAFTTTAADGVDAATRATPAAIFFRANLQWVGGLATLLTFVLFLGPIQTGGMPKPRNSMGEAATRTTGSINRIALNLFKYYMLATLVCFSLLMLSGVDAFSSLVLTSTAITAGGYLPGGNDLTSIAGPATLFILAGFFLFSATSVFWHGMIWRWQEEQLLRHRESYYLIGACALLSLIILITIVRASGGSSGGSGLMITGEAVFNASSLVATSGLQSRPGIFALLSPALVFAVLLVGGGCYSIAGGFKFYRLGGMLFHASSDLSKLVYPHSIPKPHFGSEDYTLKLMKSIWSMFVALLGIVAAGALLLALTGMDFQASLTASIAAVTNAGPAYSADWVARGTAGWPAYFEMTLVQKLILSTVMLFGRLEVIALIVALNPIYWLRR